jgi:uncharacterized protein (TIGR03437 family)
MVASGLQTFSVPITLTVSGGPVVAAVVNAASFQAGAVSPGEIVTIYGSGIGPANLVTSRVNAQGALDSMIGGTRVFFDDVPAPMIYTSASQVSAIVPYSVAGKTTTRVTVEYQGIPSSPVDYRVVATAPALFTFNANGQGPAAALNQDSTINTQPNGADPGSIIVLYATGEGQTNPPGVDGLLAVDVYPKPLANVSVAIGGQTAEVLYAGAAPTLAAGLMQINARIPESTPRGFAVPVVITVGDVPSKSGVFIYTK